MIDPRILRAQELVRQFAEGEWSARAVPGPAGDEIDGLLVGLNRLGDVLAAGSEPDPRLDLVQRFLVEMAEGGFPGPLPTSERGDNLDAVMSGLNMLAEELKEALERQRHFRSQALYDGLTSLPNRSLLGDRLEIQLARAKRDRKRVAVIFLDLNDFKLINDRFGHAVGDAVLKETAARLRRVVRESDTVARYGGDEFVVSATAGQPDDAQRIVEQVIQALHPQFSCLEQDTPVTASIGVSLFPDHSSEQSELIRLADMAMYEQKRGDEGELHHAEGAV